MKAKMKTEDAGRATMLVVARLHWEALMKACKEEGLDRGMEICAGHVVFEADYFRLDEVEAGFVVDRLTGMKIAQAALNIINSELKALGVKL